jgi:HAD superfamily hydrolase (TIGR01509 family)
MTRRKQPGAPAPEELSEAEELPEAVVFDCDGTIADTESLADRAWTVTLAEQGYVPTSDDFQAVIGHPFPRSWAHFSARAELGDMDAFRARLRARFLDLVDRELSVHADATEVISRLSAAGVPIAVASSSSHAHVDRVLAIAGISDRVQAIVGADDVERHKPDPEPYLAAAAALGVEPSLCTAVEDTSVGLSSALAAGMFTVAVVRAHAGADQLSAAHRVVDELSVAALVRERSS